MKRDYTRSTYDTLMTTINDVVYNDEGFFDLFSDLWKYAMSLIGILDCGQYEGRINEYHAKVLDQHNTTQNELDAIFAAVEDVDAESAEEFSFQSGQVGILQKSVSAYTGAIGTGIGNITNVSMRVGELMDTCKENVAYAYDQAINTRIDQLQTETRKELVSDIIGATIGIAGAVVAIGSGKVGKAHASMWKLINKLDATFHDADAALKIDSAKYIRTDNSVRRGWVVEAQRGKKINSLKDAFESHVDEELLERGITEDDNWAVKASYWLSVGYKKAAAVADVADVGVGIYDTIDSAKGVYGNITEIFGKDTFIDLPEDEIFTSDPDDVAEGKSVLEKAIDLFTDKILTSDEEEKVYPGKSSTTNEYLRKINVAKQKWQNAQTLWGIIDTSTDKDGGLHKAGINTILGYSDIVGFAKDVKKECDTIIDYVTENWKSKQEIIDRCKTGGMRSIIGTGGIISKVSPKPSGMADIAEDILREVIGRRIINE